MFGHAEILPHYLTSNHYTLPYYFGHHSYRYFTELNLPLTNRHTFSGLTDDVKESVAGKGNADCYAEIFPSVFAEVNCLFLFLLTVHTACAVGKIQVTMRKQAKGKWTSLGQPLEFHNTFLHKKDRGMNLDCWHFLTCLARMT